MAICVGCGLVVNNGILEVNVCGTAIEPNIVSGGLQCDPAGVGVNGETGCLKVVLTPSHAGCGLTADRGQLVVKPCNEGGIVCGDTLQPDTQCIYVDVQGQGNAVCTPLATAQTACPSPNCNGLVRTCDGLWAPPKIFGTAAGCSDQDSAGAIMMSDYAHNIGAIPDVSGAPADGFNQSPTNDFVIYDNANYQILFHADKLDEQCQLLFHGNTFSTFSISFNIDAGEVWRWILWERACIAPALTGDGTIAGSPCTGTGWAAQATFYNDQRGLPAGLATVQMNDVSSHCGVGGTGGAIMWEYMITVRRLQGAGALDNILVGGTRQYRKTTTSSHCEIPGRTSRSDISLPPINFP